MVGSERWEVGYYPCQVSEIFHSQVLDIFVDGRYSDNLSDLLEALHGIVVSQVILTGTTASVKRRATK